MAIQSLRTDDCIDEVVEKYAGMIYRLALAQTRSRSDADDVFQEVFLKYIGKDRRFESEEHRKAWLIRVTVSQCKKLWTSAWYRRTEPLDADIPYASPEDSGLRDALAELPTKYRSVVHLFYYERMSIDETAKALDRKPSTVRTQLTRARVMLREKLEPV
jgi:RNA polymerase sigma-70 factor (ECF subfamily)